MEGEGFKRCSVCKKATYCGAECQRAGWKNHKNTCAPPVPLNTVLQKVTEAGARLLGGAPGGPQYDPSTDWREILKWDGRLAELMAHDTDNHCDFFLQAFREAHKHGKSSLELSLETEESMELARHHTIRIHELNCRRADLLQKMERFRDQGELLCKVADHLGKVSDHHLSQSELRADPHVAAKNAEAYSYYQKARKIGEAHGFFSVECLSCLGLARLERFNGRHAEAVDIFRNALVPFRALAGWTP